MSTKNKRQKRIDIIVSSKSVRNAIIKRRKELDLTYDQIIADAKEAGISGLTRSSLSHYFNNETPVVGYPTQRHVLFMCFRYGIIVGMEVEILKLRKEDIINGKPKQLAKIFAKQTEHLD